MTSSYSVRMGWLMARSYFPSTHASKQWAGFPRQYVALATMLVSRTTIIAARRASPEQLVQPADGPRAATPLWTAAADRAHHAAAGRHRRRAENVEVVRQLHRHHRSAAGNIWQDHVHFRRADVALLRAGYRREPGRDRAHEARGGERRGASHEAEAGVGQAHRHRLPFW